MKNLCLAAAVLFSTSAGIHAQIAAQVKSVPVSYIQGEVGPHSRQWLKVTTSDLQGEVSTTTNQAYVELATGLNYWDPTTAQWVESREQIEAFPGGAIARQGQHKVIFANNLATAGAIHLQMADGRDLRSHVIGLSYYDNASGKSVLIAEIKDCQGQLSPPNVVIYPDAFTDFKADVRYTYTRAGFEQDIILHERPPLPEEFGLNSASTVLEVLTEFISPPVPGVHPLTSWSRAGATVQDQLLDFGVMNIGAGKAFFIGEDRLAEMPVCKQWTKLEGRTFLIEQVTIADFAEQLDQLPPAPQASLKPVKGSVRHLVSNKQRMLSNLREPRLARTDKVQMKVAAVTQLRKGLVLDYVTLNSNQTNYTFRGDTTYYLSGTVNLYGTNTFEGGAVIKYTNNASLSLQSGTGLNWQTAVYRPVIFTSKDDDSVGDQITGSTGNPTNYFANPALNLANNSDLTLQWLRITFAQEAIIVASGHVLSLTNAQFANCRNGVGVGYFQSLNLNLRNVLMINVQTNFDLLNLAGGATISAQNTTLGSISVLFGQGATTSYGLTMTNCILANVTNTGFSGSPSLHLSGSYNGFYNSTNFGTVANLSSTYPFQTVGAGNCYLTNDSTFRNQGTTNIDPTLLADLQKKTTYPPINYSNVTVSINTTLNPQAQRDVDTPDLGYHYDPIDYLTYVYAVTNNSTLTVSAGTAIAYYDYAGIWLQDSSSIVSIGTPLSPNWFVRYQAVQEQPRSLDGISPSGAWLDPYHPGTVGPSGTFRFSKFACPAGGGYHLYNVGYPYDYISLSVQDCEFWNGNNYIGGGTNSVQLFRNNLFNRTLFRMPTGGGYNSSLSLSNNLFVGVGGVGTGIQILPLSGLTTWCAFNNAFDTCLIAGAASCTNGYNAYINCTNRINPTNVNDIVSTTAFNYQSGPLGNFYQPTNSSLINAGSTTADLTGLYHYTVLTNLVSGLEIKETNSVVDIGYHYVAMDSNGIPIDTNTNGIPDYFDDANGNGAVDSGEVGWNLSGDLGLKVIITRPSNNSVIP